MEHNKMTILPLHLVDETIPIPMPIADDLSLDSVGGILLPDLFNLWQDYVSKKDRDSLASTNLGVIHRFSSGHHIGKPEADSQAKIYKVFLLLRLIRPTNERYSNIQVDFNAGVPNVFGFTQPMAVPNTPNLETFNRIHYSHLKRLFKLLPLFLSFAESAPRNMIRAIRMLEIGYSEVTDPLLQFVTWMIGIESVLSGDRDRLNSAELIPQITKRLGADTNVYSEVEHAVLPTKPEPVTIRSVLPDLFEARNRVVHGVGVPSKFDDMAISSAATGEQIHYVDVLREAASFMLRKLILQAVESRDARTA
jgi:hypothetical protein